MIKKTITYAFVIMTLLGGAAAYMLSNNTTKALAGTLGPRYECWKDGVGYIIEPGQIKEGFKICFRLG